MTKSARGKTLEKATDQIRQCNDTILKCLTQNLEGASFLIC